MSWSKLSVLMLALAGLGPAGCGFHAVHALPDAAEASADGRAGANLGGDLTRIRVDPIPNRMGQLVRNALVQRLSPRGEPADPAYHLDIHLAENYADLGYRRDNYATLSNLTLTATFSLQTDDLVLLSDTATTIVSFDSLGARYASVVIERDARERAAVQIADDIRSRLAAALQRYHDNPTDPRYQRTQGRITPLVSPAR